MKGRPWKNIDKSRGVRIEGYHTLWEVACYVAMYVLHCKSSIAVLHHALYGPLKCSKFGPQNTWKSYSYSNMRLASSILPLNTTGWDMCVNTLTIEDWALFYPWFESFGFRLTSWNLLVGSWAGTAWTKRHRGLTNLFPIGSPVHSVCTLSSA